jgi:hypothetical protein
MAELNRSVVDSFPTCVCQWEKYEGAWVEGISYALDTQAHRRVLVIWHDLAL